MKTSPAVQACGVLGSCFVHLSCRGVREANPGTAVTFLFARTASTSKAGSRNSAASSAMRGDRCVTLTTCVCSTTSPMTRTRTTPELGPGVAPFGALCRSRVRKQRARRLRAAQASEVLGHSTIAITVDTYSHAIPTMQEKSRSPLLSPTMYPPPRKRAGSVTRRVCTRVRL